MTLICRYPGSRLEQAWNQSADPVVCVRCGAELDREAHVWDYRDIEGYPGAGPDDVLCSDCFIQCAECGEDLIEGGEFAGLQVDGVDYCREVYCWAELLMGGDE